MSASPRKTTTGRSTGAARSETRLGSAEPYCPDAGDFIWIDLEPTRGHEQRGRRPAIVLSARVYNQRTGLCIACAITNQPKGFRFEVAIPQGNGVTGVILADQVRCISWAARGARFIASAPFVTVEEAREKLAALVGID